MQALTGLLLEAEVGQLLLLHVPPSPLLLTVGWLLLTVGRLLLETVGRLLEHDEGVLVPNPWLLEPSPWVLVQDSGRWLALQTAPRPLLHVSQRP